MKAKFSLIHKCALLACLLLSGLAQSRSENASPRDKNISNAMTLEQIDKVVTMALPLGTSLTKIDRYFTDNGVEHSFYKPTNQVFAAIRNIKGGFFPVSKDAQIIITLDKSGDLRNVEVKAVMTGP